jgi:RimJ/RimL family protein N-acetyltransferase
MTDRPAIPERPLLRGTRLWLRPLEERDMPAYVTGINDTEVGAMAGYSMPLSVEQATAWLRQVTSVDGPRRGFFFAVSELGDDRFIGTTWLKELNLLHGNAELAILMDRDHIGNGWGTEAQRVLLDFAFRSVGLERVYLTAFARNTRAIRSYEKLGFQLEGRMRNAWRGMHGLEDGVLMAILREEWGSGGAGRG